MTKITDFTPDPKNLNQGTERGNYALERSLRDYGFARPVVADKDGVIIAGNHAYQKAGEIGLKNVRVIETDGTEIIVHKRMDLDASTARGRMVALADNRTTEINLAWDSDEFASLLEDTEDVKNYFAESELTDLFPVQEEISFDYKPILQPTQGAGLNVTDATIEKTEQHLADQFKGKAEQDLTELTCPHCDATFTVNRDLI